MLTVSPENHLYLLWVNRDADVFRKMIYMYATNALLFGWWGRVTLIIWGPSALTAIENKDVQVMLSSLPDHGVDLFACIGCTESYGVTQQMEALGIEVKPAGELLSEAMKAGSKVLTI